MPLLSIIKKGFNYAQDGPGNRLIYHLSGCNLRCPWCANPETFVSGTASEQVSPQDVLHQVLSAKSILIDSGGVTFTGGEPTLQSVALIAALSLLRENDIHTAIQTNGTCDDILLFLPHLSLLIIDFKHYDSSKHKSIVGMTNKKVIDNIRYASSFGLPVWIRTPLINGFNSSDDDISGFLAVYKTLDTTHLSFELLPYHEYGRDKWKAAGLEYSVQDGAVDRDTVKKFESAYIDAGLKIIRT